jgi:TP901 family phage tail tape measure protein
LNNIQLNIVANAQFQQVYAEVAKLKTAMNSLQKTSVGGPFTSAVTSDIKAAQSQFDSAVQSTRAFTIQQVAMTDSVNKFGQQLSRGQLSLSNYYKIWRDSAKGTSAEIDALATAQARLNRSIAIADPLKPGYAKLVTDINGVVTAEEKMLFKQQALNTALNQGSMKLIDFGKNTQWMGRQLTVGLTMPLAMFGATAAQTFLQVDQELTRMQKVYGTGLVQPTAAALKQIRSDVSALGTELARSLGISVKDTASMAADLAATGLQGAALVNATRQALRMSVLGELDHQQAMQATISLQNVYKLNTQGLADAVNFLNAVENQTSTSLKDLVDAIPRVGPIVQQLGGSFKDTAAMMVAMKEAGVPAAQGANAIKSALSSLINPTTSAAKAFAAYNINLKNIASETGGNPIMMLKALSSEIKNLDRLTQAQLIEKLFGKFQYARIQALLDNINKAGSQTATVFQLMGASGTDLANLATNELKQQTESASGKFKRMTETIKADLLPIGQSFLESFTKIGNAIDKVVSAFRTLGNFIGPVAGMLGKIFGGGIAGLIVVGPIIMLVGLFSNLIGNILRGANAIRMFKQGLESASSGENKFLAGLQGMRNFYQELDTSVIASRNQMDLMPEAITSNAKAFEILRNEIARLTDQFRLLAVAQTEAMGMSSLGTALAPFGAKFLPIVRKNSGGLLPGFANGGFVYDPSRHGPVVPGPSNVNYDSVLGSVPKGGFVVNKKSSAANPQLKSIPKFNSGGNMMAMLTPGEIVIDPKTTSNNLGMLEGINSGMLHLARGGAIGAHHRRSPVYSYTGSDVYRGQTRRMKASLGIHYNAYKAPHTRGLRGWASGGILGGLIHSSKSNYGSPYEGALAKTKIQTGVPGEHQGVADQLGLFARGSRGSDWFNRSGGTVLPSFTVATPSKNTPGGYGSFNTELVTGHASGEDWIRYANENRGASSHTGMEEFLKAANPNDPTKNKAVLEKIHKIFTERIKGYAGNLSDAIFSQEAFKAYDEVINKEFNDNPGVRKAYELEKTAIGAARTAPSKSGNRGNRTSGGSPVNVTSGGIIPFFRSLSKTRREKYQDSAFESHIFAPEYLEKMSEVPGINVHSGGMIEKEAKQMQKHIKLE